MRIAVTDQGVVIHRDWFPDVEEVDVEKTRDTVIVRTNLARDPILELGKNPVDCGISDGSEQHADKTYSMTDCISFIVMKENGSESTLSFDKHFTQAGFKVLP